jgi:hypothetical protein
MDFQWGPATVLTTTSGLLITGPLRAAMFPVPIDLTSASRTCV